ncbi:hypothetical protein LP52_11625 [Streptomonospora alba]|uniref:Uncharacterized protein n=1 Tax=Streptomonospora alba TaxID=183763 RepID=A0A0C2FHL0_9ACTN|nr:hypothetical protein [Streptomonospora alba]KIH98769.1 hypothetical protein LP52_11625 [Streptomonospora alba]
MNRPVIPAPQKTTRRRPRTAARRKATAPAPAAPQPRETAEAVASDRPLLSWVLVTDDSGRTRPEARWS